MEKNMIRNALNLYDIMRHHINKTNSRDNMKAQYQIAIDQEYSFLMKPRQITDFMTRLCSERTSIEQMVTGIFISSLVQRSYDERLGNRFYLPTKNTVIPFLCYGLHGRDKWDKIYLKLDREAKEDPFLLESTRNVVLID
ncbi:hypothetical protein COT47_04920 [Candidatus Woesearchaeota archaeon CG08_land_8_20_14_0_20_43_7]|nr:MAG: hypothetical protein COT47_04920 [Candidatus Woesearchaeota archaeon CG08_land_8_20_14_0_20_43_7]